MIIKRTLNRSNVKDTLQNWWILLQADTKELIYIFNQNMLGNGFFMKNCRTLGICFISSPFLSSRNCRCLIQIHSVLLFFDETFQLHHFSMKPSYFFDKEQPWSIYSSNLRWRSASGMVSRNIHYKKCKTYQRWKSIYWGYESNNKSDSYQQIR